MDVKQQVEEGGALGGERTVAEQAFGSEALDPRLQWVREEAKGWRLNTSEEQPGLEIVALPGGIWGNFFNDCLAKNFLFLTPDGGATVNAVEAEVSFAPRAWGEQAGIFWHSDDNNYAKFVVEGMKDGSVALVFALEINGSPRVVKKLPWEGPTSATKILRLELKEDLSLCACIVHPQGLYVRHIASVNIEDDIASHDLKKSPNDDDDEEDDANQATATPSKEDGGWAVDPAAVRRARIGLGAHGGPKETAETEAHTVARFLTIRFISVQTDRLDFRPEAQRKGQKASDGGSVSASGIADLNQSNPTSSASIEQVGNWRISADMSPEQRARVLALIGGVAGDTAAERSESGGDRDILRADETIAAPASAPRVEQVGGWRISADLSPEQREKMMALIGMSQVADPVKGSPAAPAAAAAAAAAAQVSQQKNPLESLEPEYDEATGEVRWRNPFAGQDMSGGAATAATANVENKWFVSPHLKGEQRARILAMIGQTPDNDDNHHEESVVCAPESDTEEVPTKVLAGTWKVSANASPELQQQILDLLRTSDLLPQEENSPGDGVDQTGM